MVQFLVFLISLISFSAQAEILLTAQGGYLKLTQEAAQENNVAPVGLSYGGGIGVRRQYLEFEALFLSSTAEGEIEHDSAKNKIVHEQSSILLTMNFYLNKFLYARFGYGLHKINQELKSPVSAASEAGAIKAYGLKENTLSEGVIFGAGVVLARTKSIDCFFQIEKMNYSSIESGAWNGSLGIRIYLDGQNRSW